MEAVLNPVMELANIYTKYGADQSLAAAMADVCDLISYCKFYQKAANEALTAHDHI